MFRRIVLPMVLLCAVMFITSCSDQITTGLVDEYDDGELREYQKIPVSFTEAVENSDCAAVAEFVEYIKEAGTANVRYVFEIKEVLRGEIYDKKINILATKGTAHVLESDHVYTIGGNIYTIGNEYILVMNVYDMLFYDYPHYTLPADIYIPVKDKSNGTIYGKPISEDCKEYSGDSVISFIKEAKKAEKEEGMRYTKSDHMPDIVKESDLVMEIKIIDLFAEGVFNGSPYYCEVLNVLKGGSVNRMEDGRILITLMKGSVIIGESYIIMANRVGEYSTIYGQSSLRSVIPITDTKTIEEIKDLISRG